MKLSEGNRAVTKRDLLTKLQKVEKALGTAAQRADAVERQNSELIAEVIQLRRALVGSPLPANIGGDASTKDLGRAPSLGAGAGILPNVSEHGEGVRTMLGVQA